MPMLRANGQGVDKRILRGLGAQRLHYARRHHGKLLMSSFLYYLNDDKTYRPCDMYECGRQMESMRENRTKHIKDEVLDGKRVSTVWLGIDHSYDHVKPLLFETMVFNEGTYDDLYCERYSSWDEAVKGHSDAVQWVKDGCIDDLD
jgi:hypothetical protein